LISAGAVGADIAPPDSLAVFKAHISKRREGDSKEGRVALHKLWVRQWRRGKGEGPRRGDWVGASMHFFFQL